MSEFILNPKRMLINAKFDKQLRKQVKDLDTKIKESHPSPFFALFL